MLSSPEIPDLAESFPFSEETEHAFAVMLRSIRRVGERVSYHYLFFADDQEKRRLVRRLKDWERQGKLPALAFLKASADRPEAIWIAQGEILDRSCHGEPAPRGIVFEDLDAVIVADKRCGTAFLSDFNMSVDTLQALRGPVFYLIPLQETRFMRQSMPDAFDRRTSAIELRS